MFQSISGKFYAMVVVLVIFFVGGYGLLSFCLIEQGTLAKGMLAASRVEGEIHQLNGLFSEIRFWEKKIMDDENPEALVQFGVAMERIQEMVIRIKDIDETPAIRSSLECLNTKLLEYDRTFNTMVELKNNLRFNRTALNTSYRSLISNILNNKMDRLLKPLFNLTQFFIGYFVQQNDAAYDSLIIVSDYLGKKIVQEHPSDQRTGEYLTAFKTCLEKDYTLVVEIKNTQAMFDSIDTDLTVEFDDVSLESSIIFKENFSRAENGRVSLNRGALCLAIAGILFLIVILFLFSQTIVNPIRSIARVMREVKAGNVDLRFAFDKNRRDELMEFGAHLNAMLDALQENEQERIKSSITLEEHKKLALVGKIAGKMAHDFNNILGIIMGQSELALFKCEDPKIRQSLELIFDQTLRGRNLTKNLVVFAKDQEPRQEYFQIGKKVDLILNLLRNDLKGIRITREGMINDMEVLADPGMIEHALVNLVQNSIHALSLTANPGISIRINSVDRDIMIEICDNGCGIPPEHLNEIFEPSFTLKGARDLTASYDRSIKGTGYGMANVKKYLELHNGTVTVESKPGSGTRVVLRFPQIGKELTEAEKIEVQRGTPHSGRRILLVEDESAIAQVQYTVLTQSPLNHIVDIAPDGETAKDCFDKNSYDLISLDYLLPGKINGREVYDHIRRSGSTVPVLFVSGNIVFLESIKTLRMQDAAIEYVSKPCRNLEYVNKINLLLDRIQ